jgi:ABC-2 type transport system ATP-binding protein
MEPEVVVEIDNLTKYYGRNVGIENVSLAINKGEIFGFVGPNGAGKSTTIKLLLNMLYPSSGKAAIVGLDTVSQSNKIKKFVSYVPCDVRYYADMKVIEILDTTRHFHGIHDKTEQERLIETFGIEAGKRFRELSMGNKKKVALVNAMLTMPRLIILDEPTNGLDPLVREIFFSELHNMVKKGGTIFLSSHNLYEIGDNADRVAFIKKGKIISIESISKTLQNYKIVTIKGGNASPLLRIGALEVYKNTDEISFKYSGDARLLAKAITESEPSDFIVRNLSIAEQFKEYYTDEEETSGNS